MKKILHAGIGEKSKVTYIAIENIHVDSLNPRLPEEVIGKSETIVLEALYRYFNLDELAFSMAQNGYFDEEPIVVVAKVKTKTERVVVVEGNRRVATIKILLDPKIQSQLGIRSWPSISKEVAKDISSIPAIMYEHRDEVLPYLGVRHIAGIMKWDSYAKARYVASMVSAGYSMNEIQEQIGDRQNSARKHYLCYRIAQQARDEFDFNTEPVKENFSYLMLATGQGSIKRYLGLPPRLDGTNLEAPVPTERVPNLKNLLSLIFGEGKGKPSVLAESRDITNYLTHILASDKATEYLLKTRDLLSAYDLSDGEEVMVKKFLATANQKLEAVLGIIHRHRTRDVLAEIEKCAETVNRLVEVAFKEKN
jgi:hypothetical protein